MKNRIVKRFVSTALTIAMAATLLTGCGGNSEDTADGGTTDAEVESTADEGGEADTNAEASGDQGDADDGESTEIVVALMSFAPIDAAIQDRVEAAVNAEMSEMINVTADILWFDVASYAQQIPMMIQAGEQLDAILYSPIPTAGYSGFMSQNQLMDITDYVDEYGADIKAVLGEDGLAATTKDGRIYAVGNNLSHFGGEAIIMRQDVLQEIGMEEQFENMTTWTDLEEIVTAAVGAGYGGVINTDTEGTTITPQPYISGAENLADAYWVDMAGDGNLQVYIDPETDTIKCFFENEDYKNSLLRVGDWYDKGLIYKDASTADEFGPTLIKNGVGTVNVRNLESGWEATEELSCGHPVSVKFLTMSKVSTGSYTKFGWCVPVTSQEPEAAVKFINLLYSNNKVHDTMCYGEEGVDWVRGDGVANYPDGMTEAEYHLDDYLFGDAMSITPWGDDPDLNVRRNEENASVESSKYIGFSIDNTNVASEVTSCQNICNEYKTMLASGTYGGAAAEEKYNEWIEKLKAAGMDKIVAEYQSQLDAWLAEQ